MKTNNFKNRVLNVVAEIPKGETLSYKQVAQLAGSPNAYRAVGSIMKNNSNPYVPCHRVVESGGGVGGYNQLGGSVTKRKILEEEGVIL